MIDNVPKELREMHKNTLNFTLHGVSLLRRAVTFYTKQEPFRFL